MNRRENCLFQTQQGTGQRSARSSFAQKALLLFFVLVLCFIGSVKADTMSMPTVPPDATRQTRVTFTLSKPFTVQGSEKMRLYRIGEYDGQTWKVSENFASYPVSFSWATKEESKALANTLLGYIQRDHVQPDVEKEWSKDGRLVFSTKDDGVKQGLYLGVSDAIGPAGKRFVFSPVLFSLPGVREDNPTAWLYEQQITLKGEPKKKTEQAIEVFKVWKGDSKANRPDKIVVQLLKNGNVVEEVLLQPSNYWRYRWEHLSTEADWRVVEKEVPDGYQVKVETLVQEKGKAFVLTNTKTPPPPEEPPKPGTPPDQPKTPPHLTQTGLSRLPVVVLSSIGFTFLLLALALRKKSK